MKSTLAPPNLRPFARDCEILERIESGRADPFQARIQDIPIPNSLGDSEAEAVVNHLIAECDSLRTRVCRSGAATLMAEGCGGLLAPVKCLSISSLAEIDTADDFLERERGKIDLVHGPVAAFWYFRLNGQRGGIVRVLTSHFATDMGTQRLFARTVADFVSGRRPRATTRYTYLDWMESHFQYAVSTAGRTEADFWMAHAAQPIANARRTLVGATGRLSTLTTIKVPESTVARLRERCQVMWNCRALEAVAASILQALAEHFNLETVPVAWTTHGRHPLGGHHFTATTGWLSNVHPLSFTPMSGGGRSALESMRASLALVPNAGCTYPWIARFSSGFGQDYAAALKAPIKINLREGMYRPMPCDRTFGVPYLLDPAIKIENIPLPRNIYLRMNIVVDLKRALRISLKSECEDSSSPSRKIIDSIINHIYHYAST